MGLEKWWYYLIYLLTILSLSFYLLLLFLFSFGYTTFNILSIMVILTPLAIFLLFLLFSVKYIKSKGIRQPKVKLIIVLSLLGPLLCFGVLGFNEYRTHFTIEKWNGNPGERLLIVDSLIKNYPLEGQTREEITNLLGAPREVESLEEGNNIIYHLGIGTFIANYWLIIWFDDDDIVEQYEVRRH